MCYFASKLLLGVVDNGKVWLKANTVDGFLPHCYVITKCGLFLSISGLQHHS